MSLTRKTFRYGTILALSGCLVLAVGLWLRAQEDPKLARFNALSRQLVCQCGCNQVLAFCSMLNCHSATPMRKIIRDEIEKGTSDQAIIEMFVRQYGQVVLAEPPAKGFNLTAWIMPFVALAAGSVLAYAVAVRMRRNRVEKAAPSTGTAAAAAFDSQVEKELQSFEERE